MGMIMRARTHYALVFLILFFGCDQMKDSKDYRPLIVAHRGASGLAPENTLASLRKAMDIGSDYSEIDVHLTKDGRVVLLHDDTLNRTTNDSGKIYEKTLAELKGVDAGGWFGPQFRGEPIPTLESVIETVRGNMKLNVEIKISGYEPDIAERVIEIIRAHHFEKECMVTSFDSKTIRRVEELAPDLQTGLIIGEEYEDDPFNGPWDLISTNYKNVTREFVTKAGKTGKPIHVWTVNDPKEMQRLMDLKVEGIITNYPHILKEILEKK